MINPYPGYKNKVWSKRLGLLLSTNHNNRLLLMVSPKPERGGNRHGIGSEAVRVNTEISWKK
jgi:hypothetical protein